MHGGYYESSILVVLWVRWSFLFGNCLFFFFSLLVSEKEGDRDVSMEDILKGWCILGTSNLGFLGGSVGKNLPASAGYEGSIPGSGKIPWRRKWQPTPVFLPRKSHGQRSLEGYSQGGCKRFRHDLVTKQQQQSDCSWGLKPVMVGWVIWTNYPSKGN